VHRQISDRVAQELLIECALIRKVPEGEEGKRQQEARLSEATRGPWDIATKVLVLLQVKRAESLLEEGLMM